MTGDRVPPWVTGALMVGGVLAFAWLERRRPLRSGTEPKLARIGRNLAVAAAGAVVAVAMETPLTWRLLGLVEDNHWGLLPQAALPGWAETALAVVLLDYSMYWWHLLNHRMKWLWRTHLPHHADLDLDASTALRFHFTEMLTTLPWRAVQITAIGAGPLAFTLWQCWFVASILFHHSNLALDLEQERRLLWLLVTPRMHGIHHSVVPEEADANFSSGLSLWDRLHGTMRVNVAQRQVKVGVPAFRSPAEVTLLKVLAMPFTHLPDVWKFPDGERPRRAAAEVDRGRLLA